MIVHVGGTHNNYYNALEQPSYVTQSTEQNIHKISATIGNTTTNQEAFFVGLASSSIYDTTTSIFTKDPNWEFYGIYVNPQKYWWLAKKELNANNWTLTRVYGSNNTNYNPDSALGQNKISVECIPGSDGNSSTYDPGIPNSHEILEASNLIPGTTFSDGDNAEILLLDYTAFKDQSFRKIKLVRTLNVDNHGTTPTNIARTTDYGTWTPVNLQIILR